MAEETLGLPPSMNALKLQQNYKTFNLENHLKWSWTKVL